MRKSKIISQSKKLFFYFWSKIWSGYAFVTLTHMWITMFVLSPVGSPLGFHSLKKGLSLYFLC